MSLHSQFRRWLRELPPEAQLSQAADVVVGLSGGADSLALTRAAVRVGLSVHAVVVDHQLQADSGAVARRAAEQATHLGAASAHVVACDVDGTTEGAARHARYQALGHAAAQLGKAALPVLVAHTARDDAEGVILGLIRGSGAASLAGMRPVSFDHPVVDAGAAWLGRPLLTVTREMTEQECVHAGLSVYEDPHNSSADYLRSRVRTELFPVLNRIAGQDVSANLSRTARLLRQDEDALTQQACQIVPSLLSPDGERLDCKGVMAVEGALRRRIIKQWLSPTAGALTSTHLERIEQLVVNYTGQGAVSVPWPTMDGHAPDHARLAVARVTGYLTIIHEPR
ncbi:tRNA lysidine(34) synthetase TilS [Corynebacterium sp. 320]|uniref:tRNA lysidine(34) synthetase TilS n=1 Tax=Corynebacterium TaxID=1716 RepID=UPI00125CBE75|nr:MULTISPECIES: tRNA lysidine(34) synthetase TilS [Corynebacterium]KAB1503067.1 tRNA lysidine(34) synthetase TilS [Corynebacterium sp. 320]KAB1550722.1 tRNA lysidine(34) synthetase TilS [Corynebacterium sp. 321]KAB1551081.1 tRNA lysidine(34) synthetase TilS [Corynebacterium sp. 319]KAB3526864.1 tRNA lysidine(34) synthetase TilS [Corynebacterium sp. 250]KAB3538357.1 tRNA lysidine(34) synthetase TilS [Corynebacterium sp. 366]